MTNQQQADNAIKWIDDLLVTKDPQGQTCLGDYNVGYCCLGKGCKVLNIIYDPMDGSSGELKSKVGLFTELGQLKNKNRLPKGTLSDLASLNDMARWSFKKIGQYMIKEPQQMFLPKVAELINKHYTKSQ